MAQGRRSMPTPLPRSSPLDHDVDPAAVLGFLDVLEAHRDIELHSLMVVRLGHVVAEGWWSPYTPERRHLLYSLSKSFTSTAAAFAQAEGLLHLDDPVVAHFPEWGEQVRDPRSRSLTLRHVAAMASGHTRDMVEQAFSGDPQEPVRAFLSIRPDREPGTVFAYNQPCTYALAAVVQRRAGMTLSEYLRPRLLDPLGIGEVGWSRWPPGRELGFTGLHARTEDVAKLGLLHLQRGRWGSEQLLSSDWVDRATSKQIDNPDEPHPDWRRGYGYQFWMSRHGYRGDGAFGQFCVVLPEQDSVVAITAATEQMQAVLDALWERLLPGLGRRGDAAAAVELASRLGSLSLPPCASGSSDGQPPGETEFTVVAGGGSTASALTAVRLSRDAGGVLVTLRERDNELSFAVGRGEWAVSEPVDARGGTVPVAASSGADGNDVRVEVIFLETPHRLDVTLSPPHGTAVALWRHRPLGEDRIEDLHSP